jgi:hypothetical protein
MSSRSSITLGRPIIAVFSSCLLVTPAHANELWSCQLADDLGNDAMRVTFEVRGKKLVQKWEAGIESDYDVAQNNEYGLVGLFSMSEIAPAETKPTVGASAVAINKNTNEVWMSTVIAGELSFANELSHGACVLRP